MKSKTFVWLCLALFICSACERETIKPDDPTTFTSSSIVGIWACIASDNLTYDIFTGQQSYHWDYDPNAQTYDVLWYFDIKSDSKVQYVERTGETKRTLVDANYIFDQEHQAIRCPSGKIMGFTLESTAEFLGSDTIFYVKRKAIDEAVIYDNTGYIKSQYVVRVKGIKNDL